MEICLVGTPTAAEFNRAELKSETVRVAVSQPQLGILSLASVLECRGLSPTIVDLNSVYLSHLDSTGSSDRRGFTSSAAACLAAQNADVYGFSTICSSYPLTIRIASTLKVLRPDCTVIFGGPQASVVDLQTLSNFAFVDFVLRGEAEYSLLQWLEALHNGTEMTAVLGLTYRQNGVPRRNRSAPPIHDLDELPLPAYHLTDQLRGAHNAALEMGRGCPFACTFCSTNDFFRRNFRLRSPERILCDMQALHAEYDIRDFELVHDMFTVDRRRVVAFCETMINAACGFSWSCSARTDCVDEALIKLMAQAGCSGVFYGIETGSVRMQELIEKRLDPYIARDIINITERYGIRSTVSLITGFPEETWEDLRETVSVFMHSARLPLSSPQLNLLAPLAETPLHTEYKDRLVIEDLCSDISQQGVNLDSEDLALIREYPEIFPSFYLVPTKHLDRSCLLELREFCLSVDGRLHWLLLAVDQATDNFLDLFAVWRQWRLQLHPSLTGFSLREYYRSNSFRADYTLFVREMLGHESPAALSACIECEEALCNAIEADPDIRRTGHLIEASDLLNMTDVPVRKPRTRVISLRWDLQRTIDALKSNITPKAILGSYYYVAKEGSHNRGQLHRISDWVAHLLWLSDGTRDAAQILECLKDRIKNVGTVNADYVFPELIGAARRMQLLDIYRIAAKAAGFHETMSVM